MKKNLPHLILAFTFLTWLISCDFKNDLSLSKVDSNYPLNFDFKEVNIQGQPLGWDFRYVNFLGFSHELTDSGLSLSNTDSTDQISIDYLIPGIYLERKKISLSVRYEKKEPSLKNPILRMTVRQDFFTSEIISARLDTTSSKLIIDNIDIPIDTKDLTVSFLINGPTNIKFSPIELQIDGKTITELPKVSESDLVKSNLHKYVYPLRSNDSKYELKSLIKKLGSAKYILIGESVHSAKEFHEFKIVLTKALRERDGEIVVALEDNMFAINNLMNKDEIDSESFNKSVFGVWASTQFYEFFKESKLSGSVIITGVDVQSPIHSAKYLKSLGSSVIGNEGEQIINNTLDLLKEKKLIDLNEKGQNELIHYIENIEIKDSKLNPDEIKFAQLSKLQLIRSLQFAFNPTPNLRDQLMAENLKSLSRLFGNKDRIIFWGHDGHVRKNEGGMGGFLEQIVDEKVISLSLQTISGDHMAYGVFNGKLGWGTSPLIELPQGTMERLVWEASKNKDAYLMFDELPSDMVEGLLNVWRPVRNIGATATDLGINSWKIDSAIYDGIIVLRSTSAIKNPS
jgi:erythromycin esterase-like protein